MVEIQQTHDIPLADLAPLIEESEAAGFRFLTGQWNDGTSGRNRFDQVGGTLFVAEVDGKVVGVCGINKNPYDAASQSGRVHRLYFAETRRRTGVGRALVLRVIQAAIGHFSDLTVRTDNPDADVLCRILGFERSSNQTTHTQTQTCGAADNRRLHGSVVSRA